MEIKDNIKISEEFSDALGARYIEDGDNSGEEFLKIILLPRYEKAVNEKYIVEIDLDDVLGFPSSFVSGSFGKLSLLKGANNVLTYVSFKSSNRTRKAQIIYEIENPRKGVKDV